MRRYNVLFFLSLFAITGFATAGFSYAQDENIISIRLPAFDAEQAYIVKVLDTDNTVVSPPSDEQGRRAMLSQHLLFSKHYQIGQLDAKSDIERSELALHAIEYYRSFGPLMIIKPISSQKVYWLLSEDPLVNLRQLLFRGDVEHQLELLLDRL